jgi:diacylglycerol kinase family enzyme
VDGDDREVEAATVVVANSAYYGKGMRIAPGAAVADGLLDVVVIEAASRLALMHALPSVYDGSHVDRAEVHLLTGSRVEIRGRARGPIPVGGDGEPLGTLPDLSDPPALVEVRPGALCVLVP